MRIILSRTDSIGDVVLTLPMAGVLKQQFPGCYIIFLGRKYTRPVIEACMHVDLFVDWDEVAGELAWLQADVIIHVFPVKAICRAARQARIPLRIATAGRLFSWFTCNRLPYIPRKDSRLHESQLNLKLLAPLGINCDFALSEIPSYYGLSTAGLPCLFTGIPDDSTLKTVVLHPRSKGSAREWGLENFGRLISLLPADKFNLVVTGTQAEGESMRAFLDEHLNRITDLTGRLTLPEFLGLIGSCYALVAASTGPLHLAAALGKRAIGLYAPMRPIFPTRWAPLGTKATWLVLDKICSDCRKTNDCKCIRSIKPEDVAALLN